MERLPNYCCLSIFIQMCMLSSYKAMPASSPGHWSADSQSGIPPNIPIPGNTHRRWFSRHHNSGDENSAHTGSDTHTGSTRVEHGMLTGSTRTGSGAQTGSVKWSHNVNNMPQSLQNQQFQNSASNGVFRTFYSSTDDRTKSGQNTDSNTHESGQRSVFKLELLDPNFIKGNKQFFSPTGVANNANTFTESGNNIDNILEILKKNNSFGHFQTFHSMGQPNNPDLFNNKAKSFQTAMGQNSMPTFSNNVFRSEPIHPDVRKENKDISSPVGIVNNVRVLTGSDNNVGNIWDVLKKNNSFGQIQTFNSMGNSRNLTNPNLNNAMSEQIRSSMGHNFMPTSMNFTNHKFSGPVIWKTSGTNKMPNIFKNSNLTKYNTPPSNGTGEEFNSKQNGAKSLSDAAYSSVIPGQAASFNSSKSVNMPSIEAIMRNHSLNSLFGLVDEAMKQTRVEPISDPQVGRATEHSPTEKEIDRIFNNLNLPFFERKFLKASSTDIQKDLKEEVKLWMKGLEEDTSELSTTQIPIAQTTTITDVTSTKTDRSVKSSIRMTTPQSQSHMALDTSKSDTARSITNHSANSVKHIPEKLSSIATNTTTTANSTEWAVISNKRMSKTKSTIARNTSPRVTTLRAQKSSKDKLTTNSSIASYTTSKATKDRQATPRSHIASNTTTKTVADSVANSYIRSSTTQTPIAKDNTRTEYTRVITDRAAESSIVITTTHTSSPIASNTDSRATTEGAATTRSPITHNITRPDNISTASNRAANTSIHMTTTKSPIVPNTVISYLKSATTNHTANSTTTSQTRTASNTTVTDITSTKKDLSANYDVHMTIAQNPIASNTTTRATTDNATNSNIHMTTTQSPIVTNITSRAPTDNATHFSMLTSSPQIPIVTHIATRATTDNTVNSSMHTTSPNSPIVSNRTTSATTNLATHSRLRKKTTLSPITRRITTMDRNSVPSNSKHISMQTSTVLPPIFDMPPIVTGDGSNNIENVFEPNGDATTSPRSPLQRWKQHTTYNNDAIIKSKLIDTKFLANYTPDQSSAATSLHTTLSPILNKQTPKPIIREKESKQNQRKATLLQALKESSSTTLRRIVPPLLNGDIANGAYPLINISTSVTSEKKTIYIPNESSSRSLTDSTRENKDYTSNTQTSSNDTNNKQPIPISRTTLPPVFINKADMKDAITDGRNFNSSKASHEKIIEESPVQTTITQVNTLTSKLRAVNQPTSHPLLSGWKNETLHKPTLSPSPSTSVAKTNNDINEHTSKTPDIPKGIFDKSSTASPPIELPPIFLPEANSPVSTTNPNSSKRAHITHTKSIEIPLTIGHLNKVNVSKSNTPTTHATIEQANDTLNHEQPQSPSVSPNVVTENNVTKTNTYEGTTDKLLTPYYQTTLPPIFVNKADKPVSTTTVRANVASKRSHVNYDQSSSVPIRPIVAIGIASQIRKEFPSVPTEAASDHEKTTFHRPTQSSTTSSKVIVEVIGLTKHAPKKEHQPRGSGDERFTPPPKFVRKTYKPIITTVTNLSDATLSKQAHVKEHAELLDINALPIVVSNKISKDDQTHVPNAAVATSTNKADLTSSDNSLTESNDRIEYLAQKQNVPKGTNDTREAQTPPVTMPPIIPRNTESYENKLNQDKLILFQITMPTVLPIVAPERIIKQKAVNAHASNEIATTKEKQSSMQYSTTSANISNDHKSIGNVGKVNEHAPTKTTQYLAPSSKNSFGNDDPDRHITKTQYISNSTNGKTATQSSRARLPSIFARKVIRILTETGAASIYLHADRKHVSEQKESTPLTVRPIVASAKSYRTTLPPIFVPMSSINNNQSKQTFDTVVEEKSPNALPSIVLPKLKDTLTNIKQSVTKSTNDTIGNDATKSVSMKGIVDTTVESPLPTTIPKDSDNKASSKPPELSTQIEQNELHKTFKNDRVDFAPYLKTTPPTGFHKRPSSLNGMGGDLKSENKPVTHISTVETIRKSNVRGKVNKRIEHLNEQRTFKNIQLFKAENIIPNNETVLSSAHKQATSVHRTPIKASKGSQTTLIDIVHASPSLEKEQQTSTHDVPRLFVKHPKQAIQTQSTTYTMIESVSPPSNKFAILKLFYPDLSKPNVNIKQPTMSNIQIINKEQNVPTTTSKEVQSVITNKYDNTNETPNGKAPHIGNNELATSYNSKEHDAVVTNTDENADDDDAASTRDKISQTISANKVDRHSDFSVIVEDKAMNTQGSVLGVTEPTVFRLDNKHMNREESQPIANRKTNNIVETLQTVTLPILELLLGNEVTLDKHPNVAMVNDSIESSNIKTDVEVVSKSESQTKHSNDLLEDDASIQEKQVFDKSGSESSTPDTDPEDDKYFRSGINILNALYLNSTNNLVTSKNK